MLGSPDANEFDSVCGDVLVVGLTSEPNEVPLIGLEHRPDEEVPAVESAHLLVQVDRGEDVRVVRAVDHVLCFWVSLA